MKTTLRQLLVPAFLFLCLILGGSTQSVWGVLALQLIALLIIAWTVIAPADGYPRPGKTLLLLIIAALVLVGLQLVPLPPALWSQLPGRELIAEGYRALDQHLPWQPVSLTPYRTLETILFLLPPIAIILAVLRLRAYRDTWVAIALLTATLLAILLGYLQVSTGKFGRSGWYLYDITNVGSAVGFFANRNHMGTLLLMSLPFVAALFFVRYGKDQKHAIPLVIFAAGGVLTILLGIAINGSLAAVALAVPVIAASATLIPPLGRFRTFVLSAAAVGLIGALNFLAGSPVQPQVTGEPVSSFESRQQIWAMTMELIGRTFPVGTGFGSFERVYPLAEAHGEVGRTYVNNAHNDYLELILEGGIAAILLLLLFFAWWVWRAVRIFASPAQNRFGTAAVIASGAVLAHSFVDYPLRTTAIAAVFAFCLALMARPASAGLSSEAPGSGRSAARHEVIG